jgi:uncharacterized membrane protein
MQNPPPGPPSDQGPPPQPGQVPPAPQEHYQQPYQQPAYVQPAGGAGIDKRTGGLVAYLLWWVTGVIMLFAGKNDLDVKYHAAQSIVFFGSITAIQIVLEVVGNFVGILFLVNLLVWLFAFVMWIVVLIKVWSARGARFDIPIVGGVVRPWAERLAASVG